MSVAATRLRDALRVCSNYAPTLHVNQRAEQEGCGQVLWLYGEDEKLTEVFLYFDVNSSR